MDSLMIKNKLTYHKFEIVYTIVINYPFHQLPNPYGVKSTLQSWVRSRYTGYPTFCKYRKPYGNSNPG